MQHADQYGGHIEHVFGALGGYAIDLPSESAASALQRNPSVALLAPNLTYPNTEAPPPPDIPTTSELLAMTPQVANAAPKSSADQLGPETTCFGVPYNVSPPTISGSATLGSTLTGWIGSWDTDGGGISCLTYTMAWQKFTSAGTFAGTMRTTNLTPTNQYDSLTLSPSDTGYKYRLQVTASDFAGSGTAYSSFTPVVYCSGSTQALTTGTDRMQADFSVQVAGNCQGSVSQWVAVIDSGVNLHTDLNVVTRQSCVGGAVNDDFGHGTEVAGALAAKDNSIGVVGAAPGAPILSERIYRADNSTTDQTAICGLDNASFTRIDGITGNDVEVAVLPWKRWEGTDAQGKEVRYGAEDGNCGNTNGDPLHMAVCRATNTRGMVVVAAAANADTFTHDVAEDFGAVLQSADICSVPGKGCDTRPASYNEVLAVTAMSDYNGSGGGGISPTCGVGNGNDDAYWPKSFYATQQNGDVSHTIAGPGACIRTTTNTGGYTTDSGTSLAAPYVAGVVALCIARGPCNYTQSRVANIITKVRSDAQNYSLNHSAFRFAGDGGPSSSTSPYYGYLAEADDY